MHGLSQSLTQTREGDAVVAGMWKDEAGHFANRRLSKNLSYDIIAVFMETNVPITRGSRGSEGTTACRRNSVRNCGFYERIHT